MGEVKFLAVPNRDQKSYLADDFDGWVYADGSKYPRATFPKAYALYQGLPGSTPTAFAVPRLDNFLTPNPGTYMTDAMRSIAWQNRLPAHRHDDINSSQLTTSIGNIKLQVTFPVFGGNSASGEPESGGIPFPDKNGNSFHVKYKEKWSTIDYSMTFDLQNMQILPTDTIAEADA